MDKLFADFAAAQSEENGYILADTISPEPGKDGSDRVRALASSYNANIQNEIRYRLESSAQLTKNQKSTWLEVYTAHYRFAHALATAERTNLNTDTTASWNEVYSAWLAIVNALLKGYQNNSLQAWTIPCLYTAAKYLRIFAIKADDAASNAKDNGLVTTALTEEGEDGRNEKLEDAARQINRIFSVCHGDRNPIEESRKWALYYVACLLFKTYFRLNKTSLCKNIIRTISASADMPPLSAFPKAHQVTFNYYLGVIHFMDENYTAAEAVLEQAYTLCSSSSIKNMELILMYLIPTKMITRHQIATPTLLQSYPHLKQLYMPVINAVKTADLAGLDAALAAGESVFVKRRVYLTLERVRDIATRNLFRKVFLAGGFDDLKEGETKAARRTRLPIADFSAALLLAGAEVKDGEGGVDVDEVECVIANMIYKNLMKGYIARDRGMIVLSKAGAFPGIDA